MQTFADRLTRHLIARQRRNAIHELYESAADAGLIESAFIIAGKEESGLVWRLSQTAPALTGDPEVDRVRVARALRRRPHPHAGEDDDAEIDIDTVRSAPRGRTEREARAVGAVTPRLVVSSSRLNRDALLRLIREHLPPPLVSDMATALLIARAVGESGFTVGDLSAILRRPSPIIVIRAATHTFESRFGQLLNGGLITRGRFRQVDGLGHYALDGSFRDNSGDRRLFTLSGKVLRDRGRDVIRGALMKPSVENAPMVIADELATPLPVPITAAADLVLSCAGLDHAMIAEVMQYCAGIAPKASLAALQAVDLDATALGIDDLVLAVRPGRTVRQMVAALKTLEVETRKAEDDDDDEAQDKKAAARRKVSSSKTQTVAPTFDLVQPLEQVAATCEVNATASTDRLLLVETLAGFGEAKVWAADLKQDLALWREGQLGWADMSTKLLLSGPPGTGKTTYARALCNSLRIPMLATSVAQWLEPGYLGDVLKLMSSAFEMARRHAPCILFIDEADNIGRRGGGDRFPEYWDSLINRMLELLDGVGRTEGVIVVAATNRPEKIDPALLRSGRLERHVVIPKPDTAALAGILAHHLGGDLERVLSGYPAGSAVAVSTDAAIGKATRPTSTTAGKSAAEFEPINTGVRP